MYAYFLLHAKVCLDAHVYGAFSCMLKMHMCTPVCMHSAIEVLMNAHNQHITMDVFFCLYLPMCT